jgi:hypothetical protein
MHTLRLRPAVAAGPQALGALGALHRPWRGQQSVLGCTSSDSPDKLLCQPRKRARLRAACGPRRAAYVQHASPAGAARQPVATRGAGPATRSCIQSARAGAGCASRARLRGPSHAEAAGARCEACACCAHLGRCALRRFGNARILLRITLSVACPGLGAVLTRCRAAVRPNAGATGVGAASCEPGAASRTVAHRLAPQRGPDGCARRCGGRIRALS